MRIFTGIVMIGSLVLPVPVSLLVAPARVAGPNPVAVGAGAGFLPANAEEESARALETAAPMCDAFIDHHDNAQVSIRGGYGWARPVFEGGDDRALRRQHVTVSVAYDWPLGAFRAYARVGSNVIKPVGLVGWGLEVRTEMNVHLLTEDDRLPEPGMQTLSAFTWVFGVKVPF